MTNKKTAAENVELYDSLRKLAGCARDFEIKHAETRLLLCKAVESLDNLAAYLMAHGNYGNGSPIDKAVKKAVGIIAAFEKETTR